MAAPLLKNVPLSARMLPMRELANVITRSKTTKSPLVSYLKAADASVLEKPQEPLKTFKERVAGSLKVETAVGGVIFMWNFYI